MPLSQLLLEGLAESGDIGGWQERQAKHQMSLLDLQEKQRAIADAQRLRELYASGNEPSMRDVMAISPEFGQKMQQFNNEQMLRQFQMLESQGKIEENQRKTKEAKQHTFANTLGPLIENWQESLGGRQPTAQDLETFKGRLGGALKFLDETYGYKPDVPIDPYHPEQVLGTAESLGYASRRAKAAEAQQGAYAGGVGRAQAPVPSGVEMTPQGPMVRPGLPTGMPATPDLSQFGPATKATAEDVPMLEEAYKNEKDPSRKNQIGRVLNELRQQSGFVSPQEASAMRIEEKQKEAEIGSKAAGETKSAQIKAEEEAADKKSVDAYFRMKPPEQVRDLIKESLAGDLETSLAKLGKLVGVSTPGGAPTAALKVITQQLASTSPFAPGSQSDVEYKARLAKIGDPASDEPIENRLAALDEFYRDQEAFITQKWKPESQNDILDMRAAGYISEDNARKVFRRFKQSKSGAM
jgi:hypothetical protein